MSHEERMKNRSLLSDTSRNETVPVTRFDLILSAQMRWFVQMSLTDWVLLLDGPKCAKAIDQTA